MNLRWSDIRALDGSQAEGFEELCSQLARIETPPGAEFVRKGTPDAGVECYCVLEDGREWGWQSKFFLTALGDPQWNQLDRSVKAALEAHPNLVRYYVCVPRNRSDGRRKGIKTEMQKWEDRVTKWEGWAQERGMTVEFVWWGSSELANRLSLPSQAGRHWFWFGRTGQFSEEWFEKQHKRAVGAAGPRYTPEIHVEVPLIKDFESFGRSETAEVAVRLLAKEIKQVPTSRLVGRVGDDACVNLPESCGVENPVYEVVRALSKTLCPPHEKWQLLKVNSLIDDALHRVRECKTVLASAANGHRTRGPEEGVQTGGRTNPYSEAFYQAGALDSALSRAERNVRHLERVVNSDLMIVTGDAGTGKTHLLCDMASQRLGDKKPTVILMGHQFTTADHPWIQSRAQLDLGDLTMEQFVGAFEAAAQVADCRALFLIDAINEGEGHQIWTAHLADFLSRLWASPWIGVVLSVRTTHIDHIVPREVRDVAYEVTHEGFAEHTYAALKRFTDHYGLDFPATPLLRPEFDNPLFLKTLCEGLQDSGQRTIPVGSEGISRVFSRYLAKIDGVLAAELDYDPHAAIVSQALGAIATQLIQRGRKWLPRSQAQIAVDRFTPGRPYSRSLYRALVDNGLLVEIPGSNPDDIWIVHFGFEWFADYLIAEHLIEMHETSDGLASALAGDDTDNYDILWAHRSTLEALGVLLPERLGIELPEVLTNPDWAVDVGRAFLQGLRWRDPITIGSACRELVEGLMLGADHWNMADIFDSLVTCALVPNHPLGSAFLDEHLRSLDMPDRDGVWSRYLHFAYSTTGPVKRLVDWAERHPGPMGTSDRETSEACVTVLAWLLTASHRFVRDRATKGLVAVLSNDVGLTGELVSRFHDVDDPYVCERVMAAAYGVAMRTSDAQAVAPLADLVYRLVFADGDPVPHILLRDYARGIIERAQHLGAEITFDATLVDPPYRSKWPHIPETNELEQFDLLARDPPRELTNAERGQVRIYSSVMNWDFAWYIIGTNASSESRRWLSIQNTDPLWQSAEELAPTFRCSLPPPMQSVFDELWGGTRTVESPIYLMFIGSGIELDSPDTDGLLIPRTMEEPYLDPVLEEQFIAMLNSDQKTAYQEVKAARDADEPRLSLDIIQRYVLWRVFDLGWTADRFGDFDSHIDRNPTRDTHKPERIGKKYQWIAYHEILAYISDRYQYRVSYHDGGPQNAYRGTWQLSVRDIDPSVLLTGAPPDSQALGDFGNWWSHETPIASVEDIDHEQWLSLKSDIPDCEQHLRFTRPQDDSTWIKLHGHDTWQSPIPPDRDQYETDRREIWLDACGYLIEATAINEFIAWSRTVNFWNRWMTEPPTPYSLFFGELGWGLAFESLVSESLELQQPAPQEGAPCPTPLRTTAVCYTAEGRGYDCSIVEGYNLHRPSPQLAKAMNLTWTGHGADFVDSQGELAAFDPSAYDLTHSTALFVREDSLQQFLNQTDSTLVWRVIGEKQAFGPGHWGKAWAGFLKLTGAYAYKPDGPTGYLNTHLEIPNHA